MSITLLPFTVLVGCIIILLLRPLVSVLLMLRVDVSKSISDYLRASISDLRVPLYANILKYIYQIKYSLTYLNSVHNKITNTNIIYIEKFYISPRLSHSCFSTEFLVFD